MPAAMLIAAIANEVSDMPDPHAQLVRQYLDLCSKGLVSISRVAAPRRFTG